MQRATRTSFSSPDADLSRAEELVENDAARHMDQRNRMRTVLEIDRRREERAAAMMQALLAQMDAIHSLQSIARTMLASVRQAKALLEEGTADSAEWDRQIAELARENHRGQQELREAAGILDARQRGGNVRVRIARGNEVQLDVE